MSVVSDVAGYLGAFIMICRLIPLLRDQLKNKRPVNSRFIFMELVGSVCLGVSAFLISAYPFIVLNIFGIGATSFILIMQSRRKNNDPEPHSRAEPHSRSHIGARLNRRKCLEHTVA